MAVGEGPGLEEVVVAAPGVVAAVKFCEPRGAGSDWGLLLAPVISANGKAEGVRRASANKFQGSLVYTASFRPARVIEQNPVSKQASQFYNNDFSHSNNTTWLILYTKNNSTLVSHDLIIPAQNKTLSHTGCAHPGLCSETLSLLSQYRLGIFLGMRKLLVVGTEFPIGDHQIMTEATLSPSL